MRSQKATPDPELVLLEGIGLQEPRHDDVKQALDNRSFHVVVHVCFW